MDHPPLKTDRKTLREFGLVFAAGLVLFFGLLLPWIWDRPWPRWPWIGAAVFAGVGLLLPQVLKPVYIVWMKVGLLLGWINTRIILGIVFFLLFAPLAMLLRLFGYDPMQRRLEKKLETYRQNSIRLPRDRMERPF
jgi:Saxitoxin biosynthesis operon protein SxtJ